MDFATFSNFYSVPFIKQENLVNYSTILLSTSNLLFVLSCAPLEYILAIIAPEILCHTLKTAPGIVANGYCAKCTVAREVASPEFCIPTSMEIALHFDMPCSSSLGRQAGWSCKGHFGNAYGTVLVGDNARTDGSRHHFYRTTCGIDVS